jgi:hypothetical protein
MRRRGWPVAILAGVLLLVAACDAQLGEGSYVNNRTSFTVLVRWYAHGKWSPERKIPPSESIQVLPTNMLGPTGCFTYDAIVATREDGGEIARYSGPLCTRQTWVVGASGADVLPWP